MSRYFFLSFLPLILLVHTELAAKVRILTFHCNQADFIEMQIKMLNKFLKDDFELIVFNDAKTKENEEWIESVCKEHQIECVRFQQEWHFSDPLNAYLRKRLQEPSTIGIWGWNAATTEEEIGNHPSVRHCHVIQYALDHYAYDHDDIVVIMDGDNFLIKPLSVRELLGDNDIVGFNQRADDMASLRCQWKVAVQEGMEMLWVVFIAFNPRNLPDVQNFKLHVDVVTGHPHLPDHTISDTGAAIYPYLFAHPELQLQAYPWQSSYTYRCFGDEKLRALGLKKPLIEFIHDIAPDNVQFFLFEHFIHFSAGSFEGPNHKSKASHLRRYIEKIL